MREQLRRKKKLTQRCRELHLMRQEWVNGLFIPKNRVSKKTELAHVSKFLLGANHCLSSPQKQPSCPHCFCDWQKQMHSQKCWNHPATQSPPLPYNCTSLALPLRSPDTASNTALDSVNWGPEFSSINPFPSYSYCKNHHLGPCDFSLINAVRSIFLKQGPVSPMSTNHQIPHYLQKIQTPSPDIQNLYRVP